MDRTRRFYDELAQDYDLIFADWNASVRRQGSVIARLIGEPRQRILDVACGMGTQALGLVLEGHAVVARDLSPRLVERAGAEAARLDLELDVGLGDMRETRPDDAGRFDAVIAFDNALPHLDSEADLRAALTAARAALVPDGVYLASIRDYDRLLEERLLEDRPQFDPPRLLGDGDRRRIVLQLWTWKDDRRYDFEHIILVPDTELGWRPRVRVATYRAIRRAELTQLAEDAGFRDVEWLSPNESGFIQPILRARAPNRLDN